MKYSGGPPMRMLLFPTGAYTIRHVDSEVNGVFTNTGPVGPYRGAGRPEAAYFIERVMSDVANALGMDQAEIRRRNFIPADAFPYTNASERHVRHRQLRAGTRRGARSHRLSRTQGRDRRAPGQLVRSLASGSRVASKSREAVAKEARSSSRRWHGRRVDRHFATRAGTRHQLRPDHQR